MNQWSARRKAFVSIIVLLCVLVIVGVPTYFSTRHTPTCDNGVKDGDETGVDCGGGCQLICKPEVLPLIVRGNARLLKIASSTYEAVVLIENPNINGRVVRAPYSFTIYSGTKSEPLKTFKRNTFIGRNSTFALFEGPFQISDAGPLRATFSWDENLAWEKNADTIPLLSVDNKNLIIGSSTASRLEAELVNRSKADVSNIEVIALLSDVSGNVVAAGKTFVDSLPPGGSAPLSFSWSESFSSEPVTIRVLPHILLDKSYLSAQAGLH